MTLKDIQNMFNRALYHTFDVRKLLMTFTVLLLCGLLFLFCRGLMPQAGKWVVSSLTFMPFFLSIALVLPAGSLLTRMYHMEVKQQGFEFKSLFARSWQLVIGASYFSIPFILGYLLLWTLLGFFMLFAAIPYLGSFLSVLLAFVPYILQLGTLLLAIASVGMLFFFTPLIALTGIQRLEIVQLLIRRIRTDPFLNIFLFVTALIPFVVVTFLLCTTWQMTVPLITEEKDTFLQLFQGGVVSIPSAILLAPTMVFFFNFAAESHALMHKLARSHDEGS